MKREAFLGLQQRREVVELTLRYVENEQRQMAANSKEAAHCQRVWLLEQLTVWYRAELRDLKHALDEAAQEQAGFANLD